MNTVLNVTKKDCNNKSNIFRISKLFVLLFILLSLLLISGCSPAVSLDTIENDINIHTGFPEIWSDGLEISEINIIKRSTDTKQKLDEIWVSVSGANENIGAIRNYKLTYVLYNDGWRYEKFEHYSDYEYIDSTSALSVPTIDDARRMLDSLDLETFASFSTLEDTKIIGLDDVYISAEDGYCEFVAGVEFTYPLLKEQVEIPLQFNFSPGAGWDSCWDWIGYNGYISNRTLALCDDIKSKWGNDDDWFSAAGSMEVSVIQNEITSSPQGRYIDNDESIQWWCGESKCYIKEFYIKGWKYKMSSWAILKWHQDEDTGELYSPYLLWMGWDEEENPYENWKLHIYPDGFPEVDIYVPYIRVDNYINPDGDWYKD